MWFLFDSWRDRFKSRELTISGSLFQCLALFNDLPGFVKAAVLGEVIVLLDVTVYIKKCFNYSLF